MSTKSDWQAIHQQMVAEQRRKAGSPPTAEELVAYRRGELSPEQEERVRELLVAYPELARSVAEPFPTEGAEPGDPDYLSDDEFAEHWVSLEKRLQPSAEGGNLLTFWRASAAIAAAMALVLGGLLWRARGELQEPRATEALLIEPSSGQRGIGGPSATLTPSGSVSVLLLAMQQVVSFDQFRVEIFDGSSASRSLWRSPTLQRGEDEMIVVVIPRRYLEPGEYLLVLYGVSGREEEKLADYRLSVPRR